MRKKPIKFEPIITDAESISMLSFDEIAETFDIANPKALIRKRLENSKNADNYWYPGLDFNEEYTMNILYLFRRKFPDLIVQDKGGYKYIEIFLNTEDKHIYRYSIERKFIVLEMIA